MDTTGEPRAKRVKKTHRGRRSSAAQTKREQRNEWYFSWFVCVCVVSPKIATASCSVEPAVEGNERTNETERGNCRTSETTSGSPPLGRCWRNECTGRERVRQTRLQQVGLGPAGHRCQRNQELTMGDSDLERLLRDTNQIFDAITTLERNIMICEAHSRETISDSSKIGCVVAGMCQSSMREHFLLSATKCDNWTNFVREVESIEHAKKTISAPTPMEIDSFQGNCHECLNSSHVSVCAVWTKTSWTVLDTELHVISQGLTERRMER